MIAHEDRGLGTGDRFAELCEDQPTTTRGDGGPRFECVSSLLPRHKLSSRTLYECAAKSEIVESPASRCTQQNRTSKGQNGRPSILQNSSRIFFVFLGLSLTIA